MCEEQTLPQSYPKSGPRGFRDKARSCLLALSHTSTELRGLQISGCACRAHERSLSFGLQALCRVRVQEMESPDTLLIPPDGGLQELSGHFENQKVMYGFCSVKDSQAALPKYVLINWVCSYGLGRE